MVSGMLDLANSKRNVFNEKRELVMSTEISAVLAEVRKLSEMQEKSALTTEQKSMLDGLNAKLDDFEEKNAENTQKWHKAEEENLEFKQRIQDLENQIITGNLGGVDFRNTDEYKALNQIIQTNDHSLLEGKQLLRTDSETSGGVLVMGEMAREIIKPITEMSPVRQYARVMTIGSKDITLPTRTGLLDASWEGEAEEDDDSTSSYGSETITPYRLSVTVPTTMDMLMNSEFDMESEIMMDANERFAQKEGLAFVRGTGVKQPMGFISDPTIAADAYNSASAGTVTGDDILKLLGELKTGYNEMLTFNRRTLAHLRTLKSDDGNYLWQPGLNGSAVSQIAGTPYFLSEDMPDIANNALPIALADWRRGYRIVDRTAISVVRDEFTRKKRAIIEFTIHRWLTGQPVLRDAFKLLRVSS